MKSDFEMIESILNKAREKEKHMKKIKKAAALGLAAAVAVCAAVGAGLMRQNTPSVLAPDAPETHESAQTNENTQPAAAAGFRLLWASAAQTEAEETVTPVTHASGVKLPASGRLVIEDAAGMSEEERNQRQAQLNDILTADWMTSESSYHVSHAASESYIGSLGVQGKFIVFVEDTEALEKIELGCGAYGKLMVMPAMQYGKVPIMSNEWRAAVRLEQSVTVTAEEYTEIYMNSDADEATGEVTPIGMYVNYDLSEALLAEKELHPDMGYEQFADDITFRAVYRDGSESVYTLLLTFDDAGVLSVTVK